MLTRKLVRLTNAIGHQLDAVVLFRDSYLLQTQLTRTSRREVEYLQFEEFDTFWRPSFSILVVKQNLKTNLTHAERVRL